MHRPYQCHRSTRVAEPASFSARRHHSGLWARGTYAGLRVCRDHSSLCIRRSSSHSWTQGASASFCVRGSHPIRGRNTCLWTRGGSTGLYSGGVPTVFSRTVAIDAETLSPRKRRSHCAARDRVILAVIRAGSPVHTVKRRWVPHISVHWLWDDAEQACLVFRLRLRARYRADGHVLRRRCDPDIRPECPGK